MQPQRKHTKQSCYCQKSKKAVIAKNFGRITQFWIAFTILCAWDYIKLVWRKLFPSIETNVNQNICEEENEVMPTATLVDPVTSVLGGQNVDEENIEEWLVRRRGTMGNENKVKEKTRRLRG